MNKFRKLIACLLAALMIAAPCFSFAMDAEAEHDLQLEPNSGSSSELALGQMVSENFDSVPNGTSHLDLTNHIAANSDMFASYYSYVNTVIEIGSDRFARLDTADLVKRAEKGGYIESDTVIGVQDKAFTLSKETTTKNGISSAFVLKHPITSGLNRISFDINKVNLDGFGNSFMYFYDFVPDEDFHGNAAAAKYGNTPFGIYFNGNNLYVSTNSSAANPDANESWNGTTGISFKTGVHTLDLIIDADQKTLRIIVDGKEIRTAKYRGDGIKTIGIFSGNNTPYWKPASGTKATVTLDNFEQEKVVVPKYDFNIADDARDVALDTVPELTFNTPITEAAAKKIVLKENGTQIDENKALSNDGLTLNFGVAKLKYDATYTVEIPKDVVAKNKLPLDVRTYTFYAEKTPEPEVGDLFSENFDYIEKGASHYDLTQAIAGNSEMFSSYYTHVTPALWTGNEEVMRLDTQELTDFAKSKGLIDVTTVTGVQDKAFRMSKKGVIETGITSAFVLKHPITSGVYRISFDIDKINLTGYGNSFMSFYDFVPSDKYSSDYGFGAYGFKPFHIGFNATNLYFSTNSSQADSTKAEEWNKTPAASFTTGVHRIDIIIDADNKKLRFMADGKGIHSGNYRGDGIRAISIYTGTHATAWKAESGDEAILTLDNFVQEKLASPAYEVKVGEDTLTKDVVTYDVPTSVKPQITFGTAIDEPTAGKFNVYEDGKLISAERELSADGLTVTFDIPMKNSAEYKIELPAGLVAKNQVGIVEGDFMFRTAHKELGITVVGTNLPEHFANKDYTATVTLTNKSTSPNKATVVVALYDAKGRMLDVEYTAVTLTGEEKNKLVSVKIPAIEDTANSVKAFYIDDLKTMYPLVTVKGN